jgi:hypothetical protein
MSDDPDDGNRNSFTGKEKAGESPPAPKEQDNLTPKEFGERGAKKS